MHIRSATPADAPTIAAIYNEAVLASTASFDLEPQSTEARATWLASRSPRHPALVVEDDTGTAIAWGALSAYSNRRAYDTTAEISLYVASGHHRQGLGLALARELMTIAVAEGLHSILARICTENVASIRLVRSLGFGYAGTMHEVGRKFDRWLDVVTYEYLVGRD